MEVCQTIQKVWRFTIGYRIAVDQVIVNYVSETKIESNG